MKKIGLEDATMLDHSGVLWLQLRETEVPHNIPVETDMFLNRLADNDNGIVFTLEDKDTSVLCSQFGVAYIFRWFKMLFEQSARWRKSHLTIDAVVSKYRSFLKVLAPISLKNGYPHFDETCIPVMHATVKRKCWSRPLQMCQVCNQMNPVVIPKTCTKPRHACFRNIVSFAGFPCKSLFQKTSRALRNLVDTFFTTWSVKDLLGSSEH